ncbi:unnamed protein product [Pelagomonas calceolata]|uniref:Ubiquitin-like protease family profile domain-containing protein n=1 Tax=Pelagomonas calceolata TaxID=35677 RepID=A0A8J2SX84_9STRA|nr:unnamed protein product [Pelagomonas calceolata]
MASFGLEGPGLNSGQRGKRQTGPSGLGAPAAKRARRPERAGAFADGDAAPGAPPPRPRLGKTKVGRPAAGERRDFGLNLPATASRDAYRNAVGAFPGMAAHRRPAAPPVAGAPPLRRRDGPSVGDLLEGPRPVAPSRRRAAPAPAPARPRRQLPTPAAAPAAARPRRPRRGRPDAGATADQPLCIEDSSDDEAAGAAPAPATKERPRRTRATRAGPAETDPTPVFQYPPGVAASDSIVVTRGDLRRLEPDEFLNDNLVDFYLKVIVADARRSPLGEDPAFGDVARDVHAFSSTTASHFFTKLREGDSRGKLKPDSEKAQRAHARVERWTRGVDVFAKKFLLVPVVEDLHWSLAIVCHPGELAKRAVARERRELDVGATEDEDEDEDCPARPCVIHMDSLRMHSAKKIEKWLRCFLEMEWRKRHSDEEPFTLRERTARAGGPPADLLLAMPKVPQQTNSCDCGVYTLRYGQEFLARAVCRGARLAVDGRDVSLCFRDHDFEAWFTGRDIAEMRRDIKKLAADLELEKIRAAYRREQAEDAAAPPAGAAPP